MVSLILWIGFIQELNSEMNVAEPNIFPAPVTSTFDAFHGTDPDSRDVFMKAPTIGNKDSKNPCLYYSFS